VGGPDQFSLYGQDLRLQDGRLVNSEGSLAGAHLTQAMGVARLVNVLGLDPDEALKMALTVPARLIGRADLTEIEGRALGELIVLDAEMHHAGSLADMLPATVRA
jgi:N-acetylglucosamine-6-phosphate deacetylase